MTSLSIAAYLSCRHEAFGSLMIRCFVVTFYKHACHRDVTSLCKIVSIDTAKYFIELLPNQNNVTCIKPWSHQFISARNFGSRLSLFICPFRKLVFNLQSFENRAWNLLLKWRSIFGKNLVAFLANLLIFFPSRGRKGDISIEKRGYLVSIINTAFGIPKLSKVVTRSHGSQLQKPLRGCSIWFISSPKDKQAFV